MASRLFGLKYFIGNIYLFSFERSFVDPIGNYPFSETKTLRDVITQSYLKTGRALTPKGIETPVILITPNIHGISPFDADSRKEAMIAGMRTTEDSCGSKCGRFEISTREQVREA